MRAAKMVFGVVFGVAFLALLGGGVAGADSSAPGWASVGLNKQQTGGWDLVAISCVDASTCTAVGGNGLIMDGAGSSWTPTNLTPPADYQPSQYGEITHLDSVSCASATSCAAVGLYTSTSSPYDRMLAVKVNGVWQPAVQPPALSTGPGSGIPSGPPFTTLLGGADTDGLQKVSCTSQLCVAVGQYQWGTVHTSMGYRRSAEALVVSGSGDGQWTSLSAPLPGDANAPGPDAVLSDVSCVGTECGAAGSYRDTTGQTQGLLVTDSNGTLTAVKAPLPANAAASNQYAIVEAIACPAAGECSAAGYYVDSAGVRQGLLLSETGGNWSATEATLPSAMTAADPQAWFTSVSCSQPGECAAVGADNVILKTQMVPLAVAERNGSWDNAVNPQLPSDRLPFATNPQLGGGQYSWLTTVSCPSVGQCEAGGTYTMKNTDFHPLLVQLNGTTWTAAGLPLPSDALVTTQGDSAQGATVFGLSCLSGIGCEGVGQYAGPFGSGNDLLVVNGSPAAGVAKAARATTSVGASGNPAVGVARRAITSAATASVRVICLGKSACTVRFVLKTKDRKTVIGQATGTVAAHTSTILHVVLNAKGQMLLKRTPRRSSLPTFLAVTEGTLAVSYQRPVFRRP
jgi:hypothetical protein